MIYLKDLRVGNHVKCKVSNDAGIYKILGINGLNQTLVIDRCVAESHLVESINPIPITDKWLLKFGFNPFELSYGTCYKLLLCIEPSHIMGDEDRWLSVSPDCEKYFLDSNYIMRLRSVHQLQNLHYILTGKELEIKN